MNRKLYLIILIPILMYTGFVFAKHFWRGETMRVEKVGDLWGKTELDVKKFKDGTEEDRRKMSYSVMKSEKIFIGKEISEIKEKLGDPDGFYFSDIYPAYFVSRAKEDKEDSWQLVFLLDRKEKVSEIIMHKNCCDRR